MKVQGELCEDMNEGTSQTLETQAEKTSEREERTTHDVQTGVLVNDILGVTRDEELLGELNWKENNDDKSAQKEEVRSSQANMRSKSWGDVKEVTRKTSEIEADKTTECRERTSHDAVNDALGVTREKKLPEELNQKENDDKSAQIEEGRSSQTLMRSKSCGNVKDGTRETSESQERTSHDAEAKASVKDVLGVTKDEELLEELNWKEIDDGKSAKRNQGRSSQAKIQRVMYYLWKNTDQKLSKHFSPREFSVGPLRAGNVHWVKKDIKLELAKKFIEDSGQTQASFLTTIKDNINELMECFRKGVIFNYDPDSLARLLFLDGCAVLQFIHSYVRGELEEFKMMNNTQAAFIQQDLFLFENQIPFKVLTLLMGVMDIDKPDKEEEKPSFYYKASIVQFVHENNICSANNVFNYYRRRDYRQMIEVLDKIKPAHLLDLLWKVSIYGSIKNVEVEVEHEDEISAGNCVLTVFDQPKKCLLNLANCCRGKWSCFMDELEEHGRRVEGQSLRSVQELKSSGITMRLSHSRGLKSVSFSAHCFGIFGRIKLPALNVNDSTVRKLLNLVAYETCLADCERYYSVTSYLNFLDLLVDTEQDVKDLRTARVLRNALGSDGEVAQFFNTLGLTYLPKPKEDHFEKIHSKIGEHYARKWKIKIAQIYVDYFRNPWPTLGIFLAPAALLLTVVQTWYAIYPNK